MPEHAPYKLLLLPVPLGPMGLMTMTLQEAVDQQAEGEGAVSVPLAGQFFDPKKEKSNPECTDYKTASNTSYYDC